jgi:hypothetical protein
LQELELLLQSLAFSRVAIVLKAASLAMESEPGTSI